MAMATASQTPLAGVSLLEQLPTELIEKILLGVASDVSPPNTLYAGADDLRCEREAKIGASFATGLLAHRLLCRTLRDCAWRAFGKVIGETLFDIRSRQSVENMAAVSKCKQLAPWMRKLTIACLLVERDYPVGGWSNFMMTVGKPDAGLTTELQEIQRRGEAWYLGSTVDGNTNNEGPILGDDTKMLISLVATHLNNLHNLEHVIYDFHGAYIPARYRALAHRYRSHEEFDFRVNNYEAAKRGAYIGLHVLLNSLRDDISSIFAEVHTLTIWNVFAVQSHHIIYENGPLVSITKAVFPVLRPLTIIDGESPSDYAGISLSYPSQCNVPELSEITFDRTAMANRAGLDFLDLFDLFKSSLRSMVLQKLENWSYEPILTHLQTFSLDKVEIRDRPEYWREPVEGISKDLFLGAAKTALLSLAQFRRKVESHWEPLEVAANCD